jgi:alpha-beta hydrolase superfamily lysophospholipase
MAMVCTAAGMAAMVVAPLASRTAGAAAPGTPAPVATTIATVVSVGEQPAARRHVPEAPAWVEAEAPAGRAVVRGHEGEVDADAPRVIVGFSLGGIAAVQIAQDTTGQYVGLVVVASLVHPDAAALKKAGVKRVVLAAGDLDMTSAPLQLDARRMAAQGLATRFVSLGKFGHGYPADMEDRMREPMTWVAGGG